MSIESIPDDILQIILEKIDIYTTLSSLPLVCTRFWNIIRGARRPFKWDIINKKIDQYSYAADFFPGKVKQIEKETVIRLYYDLNVTHVYAEEMNLENYTYILFGKGYEHESLRDSKPVHFVYIFPISFSHNAPTVGFHGNESPFYVYSTNLRKLFKEIYRYKQFKHSSLENFIRKKFIHTNEHYNSFNNVTLTNYKNRKLIKQVYS